MSASGNCSIILARIIIKLGTIGILKFSKDLRQENLINLFLSVAIISRIYFSIVIIRFFDAKTLIAISSVLHIALILPMITVKKSLTYLASLMIITSHGLVSYFLFFLITLIYEKTENRRALTLKSIESRSKILVILIATFIFLNLGLPPFINFYSETIFLSSLKLITSPLSIIIFGGSLLIRIIFTMQINTNIMFSKKENFSRKSIRRALITKSTFFIIWVLIIL